MLSRLVGLRKGLVIAACLSLSLVGCRSRNSDLPETVTIELPDGTTVEVEQGSGAPSLANSVWQFFRTAGSAALVATVNFGPGGELVSFEDNTIAPEIFGDTILFDGQPHGTTQPGLQYTAVTFGAENASGFTFDGQLAAFFAGITAATATATMTAAYVADDPDTVEGTFEISMQATIPSIPTVPDDEFAFVGLRVTE